MEEIIPNLPSDFKVAKMRDQSEFIENSLDAIEEHLIIGGLLAVIVVFLFLWNFRSTIIAALAIPTSIIASFAAIAWLGYSLNQMTMLALTLMVGIVIDDAIVVLENIYRFVEEKGMNPVSSGDRRNARDRFGGFGNDAFVACRVYSGRIYDRNRRAFYVLFRFDERGGNCGFADRFVYDHADARGALDQGRRSSKSQVPRFKV